MSRALYHVYAANAALAAALALKITKELVFALSLSIPLVVVSHTKCLNPPCFQVEPWNILKPWFP